MHKLYRAMRLLQTVLCSQ